MRVALCCNYPENGLFREKFDVLRIDRECEFQVDGPDITLRASYNGKLQIGRRRFAYSGWYQWIGNWCWDELDIDHPIDVLLYLHKRGWNVEVAETTVFRLWRETPPDAADKKQLGEALEAMLAGELTTEGKRCLES